MATFPPASTTLDQKFELKQRAGCHCGAVEFEIDFAQHMLTYLCHCTSCTRVNDGTTTLMVFPDAAVKFTKGEENLTLFESSPGVNKRPFCKTCGTRLWANPVANKVKGISPNLLLSQKGWKQKNLPEKYWPSCHGDYVNALFPINDNLPKYSGFPGSPGVFQVTNEGKPLMADADAKAALDGAK